MKTDYAWETIWQSDDYASRANRELKAEKKVSAFIKMDSIPKNLGAVLEIGCGSCVFVRMLHERQFTIESYIGVDRSATALKRAAENYSVIPGASVHLSDVSSLPLPDKSMDVIIALGVLEHIENVETVVRELRRVANNGALFLISSSNKRSFMYWARLLRQIIGLWPYGFQRNDSFRTIRNTLGDNFEVKEISVVHGCSDFPIITWMDKVVSRVVPRWGRYILIAATAR